MASASAQIQRETRPVPAWLLVTTVLGFLGAALLALSALASLFQSGLTLTTSWGSTDSALVQGSIAAGLAVMSGLTIWRDRRSWMLLVSVSVGLFVAGVVTTNDGGAAVLPMLIVLALPSTRAHFQVALLDRSPAS
jgi:hypothetical protein